MANGHGLAGPREAKTPISSVLMYTYLTSVAPRRMGYGSTGVGGSTEFDCSLRILSIVRTHIFYKYGMRYGTVLRIRTE